MKSDPSPFWQRTASPWHYVTVPEGKTYDEVGAPPEGDAVTALERYEPGIVVYVESYTNQDLIQTLDDVMKIQAEGRAKRLSAEAEMVKMESDLKVKLLQLRDEG